MDPGAVEEQELFHGLVKFGPVVCFRREGKHTASGHLIDPCNPLSICIDGDARVVTEQGNGVGCVGQAIHHPGDVDGVSQIKFGDLDRGYSLPFISF